MSKIVRVTRSLLVALALSGCSNSGGSAGDAGRPIGIDAQFFDGGKGGAGGTVGIDAGTDAAPTIGAGGSGSGGSLFMDAQSFDTSVGGTLGADAPLLGGSGGATIAIDAMGVGGSAGGGLGQDAPVLVGSGGSGGSADANGSSKGGGSGGGGSGGAAGSAGSGVGVLRTFLDFETNPSPNSAINSQLFIDTSGKRHVAFSGGVGLGGERPMRYGECSANCGSEAGWTFTVPGPKGYVSGGQTLAVEPSGAAATFFNDYSDSTFPWVFSTCASHCTTETSWTNTVFPTLLRAGFENMSVSPVWGRPLATLNGRAAMLVGAERLGYLDQRIGAYLAYCPGTCATESSWTVLRLGSVQSGCEQGEVVLTPGGGVRVAYTVTFPAAELHYAQCDANCEDPTNWYDLALFSSAGGVSLALTSTGQPRIAFYSGTAYSGSGTGLLSYGGCDGDCSTADAWNAINLPGNGNGYNGVSLALDSSDQPYIAFGTSDLSVAHCAADCASVSSSWTSVVLEDHSSVSSDLPLLLPVCTPPNKPKAFWFSGRNPSAVIANGRLAVSHDAQVKKQCGTGTVENAGSIIRYDDTPLF